MALSNRELAITVNVGHWMRHLIKNWTSRGGENGSYGGEVMGYSVQKLHKMTLLLFNKQIRRF